MTDIATDASVAVVGAGTMGAGIALVAAQAGHPVLLLDVRDGAAKSAVEGLRAKLSTLAAKGKIPDDDARAAAQRLDVADGVGDLAGCSLVIEAIAEDLAVKRTLFGELEDVLAATAVLATNTSSLSVTTIAAALRHPERVIGLHFFNPADRMRLVEVVHGDSTDPAVLEAAVRLVGAWGKTPVVCTSTPGFIVNRVARPYYGEAQRMVEEGVSDPATIDAVLREAGGFPLGPFELMDLVGQDVNLAVSKSVWEQTFGDARYQPTVFQQRLVDAGRLGRKTGRGVFSYGSDGTAIDAQPATEPVRPAPGRVRLAAHPASPAFPVMQPFIERVRAAGVGIDEIGADLEAGRPAGIALPGGTWLIEGDGLPVVEEDDGPAPQVVHLDWAHDPEHCTRVALSAAPDVPAAGLAEAVGFCQAAGVAVSVIGSSPGQIVARTVAMLVNEAVDLVARREASGQDVDTAMRLGTGYPSGPLEWNEVLPPDAVAGLLRHLHYAFPTGRYRTSPHLRGHRPRS